jgi:hypothetical protein
VSPLSQELDQEELWPSPADTFVTTWKRVLSVTSFGVLRPPIASPEPPIRTKASLVVAHIQISLGPRYLNHQGSWVDIPFF